LDYRRGIDRLAIVLGVFAAAITMVGMMAHNTWDIPTGTDAVFYFGFPVVAGFAVSFLVKLTTWVIDGFR